MQWMEGLQRAVDFIEDHLEEDMDYEEIAKQAYSSSFHFQRVFHIICGCSVGEYIRGRRLTRAGSELISGGERVIDVAMKYGYTSPESFCRAFTKFHGITPSQVKSGASTLRSFSRISLKLIIEGGTMMDYRIEKHESFKLIARRARYGGGAQISQKNIQSTWAACAQDGTLEKLGGYIKPGNIFGDAIVGVCFDNPNAGDFDYAIGAAYTGGEVTEGLTIEEIPENTWAIFPCTGAMPEAFETLMKKIYTEFFPASKYEPSNGMCIEVYPGNETDRKDFYCELWFSVKEKSLEGQYKTK